MGLIKARKGSAAPPPPGDPWALLDAAAAADRRWAAHRLAAQAGAAPALCARLAREADGSVREAILNALVAGRAPEAVDGLLPFLESEDAALRNGAIEALQQMPPDHLLPHLDRLLAHGDSDVRIFTVQVVARLPHPQRLSRLAAVLEREPHVNVCLAAVEGVVESGRREALPALDRLRQRFPDDPMVAFAVDAAHRRFAEG